MFFLQELKNKSAELENALKLAEKSNELKNAFLSNLSHEIRTPMNAIVGFSDLLVATSHDAKQEEYVSIIRASSGQLLSIIGDIIEMSMIDTKQVQLHFSSVDINKAIEEVMTSYAATLPPNGRVALRKNNRDEVNDLHIITDQVRFRTILSNLVSNAIKFTEIGYVEVGYLVSDNFVSFYVKDTGIGIDPQYHKLIFERFRKIESASTFSTPGLGIGLTLSEAFVKLLGGEITLESEPGKGSIFYFTIPCKKINQAKVTSSSQIPDMNNHLILICEDDESNILFYKELFNKTNASILWAKNGKEAVKICNENVAVELVLMDLKMPEMNGWEATKIIKQFRPDLPVIAQTAHVYSLETNSLSQKGFDDYITKPVSKSELFEKISRYIYCYSPIISLFVISCT
ncbi:MAG TPA: ATP-binding protein [Bacteroidales bacterium]|nr:ATP-binding protein [Bacteroidales bacterium]